MTEVQKNHVESCNINSDLEYKSVEEYLSIKLDKGIHIQNEEEYDIVANLLKESGIFDISQAISLRNDMDKNIMEKSLESILGLLGAGNEGIILQKKDDIIYIYNAGKNKNDLNPLVGSINNGMERINNTDYTQETIIFDSDITNISNLSREVKLLEEKEKLCDISIQQTKVKVAVLENEVNKNESNINSDEMNINVVDDDKIQEEVAAGVILNETKQAGTANQVGLSDDLITHENELNLKKDNNHVEESKKITKNKHIVASGDSIWSIVNNNTNTAKETQIILRYLTNNPEIIGLPAGANINKIRIGQKLKIPSNLLELAQKSDIKTVENNEKKSEYTVQYGDTLYSIFKTRYPNEVTSYRTFMNKFNKLKTDSKFLMKDVKDNIKGGDKIILP